MRQFFKYIFFNITLIIMIINMGNIVKADENATASKLDVTLELSNNKSTSYMTNGSYTSNVSFSSGDTITITNTEPIHGLYIIWNSIPDEWSLSYNGKTETYGKRGFLHEYVNIPEGTTQAVITFSSNEAICNFEAYSAGTLPSDVQVWNDPCTNADILVLPTHADDEALFFGGVLATYGGEQNLKVQVAFMCEFYSTARIREHERLDCIWRLGVKYYPIDGDFTDLYSESLAHAKTIYDYEALKTYSVECIRRFKPLVVVAHDFDGEYGHGGHMIFASAIAEAVELSTDAGNYPESASKYGTWNVPKTYVHLYKDNQIKMDLRKPLANMDNMTSIDIQKEAYKLHVSQQYCWFYVSDDYEYSCAEFGLYRTTVGNDTGNDMLENIKTYEQQEEEARKKAEEEASIAESISASIAESMQASEKASIEAEEQKETSKKRNNKIYIAIIILVVLVGIVVLVFLRYQYIQRQRRKRRRRRTRR